MNLSFVIWYNIFFLVFEYKSIENLRDMLDNMGDAENKEQEGSIISA